MTFRFKPVILTALSLLLLAGPAAAQQATTEAPPRHAQLTDAEVDDLRDLTTSMTMLRLAQGHLVANLPIVSAEAKPLFVQMLTTLMQAQIEHWRFRAFLGKSGVENPEPLPTLTHEQWRTRAEFHRARYALALDALEKLIGRAQAHHVDHAGYQDNLRRAKDIRLKSAKAFLAKMDPDLTWETPWPKLRAGKTVPTMVAPHGNFRLSVWGVNRGINYTMDSYEAAIAAYKAGAVKPKDLVEFYTQTAAGLDTLDRVWALTYDVPLSDDEAKDDRFCRVLRISKLKTVTAAKRFQAAYEVVSRMVPKEFRILVAKPADGWKHAVDVSVWEDFVFPESERCTSAFLKD
jgi:hypothetical protein